MSMVVDNGGRTAGSLERDIEQVFGFSFLTLILFSTAYMIYILVICDIEI